VVVARKPWTGGVKELAYDLTGVINSEGLGEAGAGDIKNGEAASVAQKAVYVRVLVGEAAHDLTGVVNPRGNGEAGAGDVDGGEMVPSQSLGRDKHIHHW
jgi:hypothetical protein